MAWMNYPFMVGVFIGLGLLYVVSLWLPVLSEPLKILCGAFLAVVIYLQGYSRGWQHGHGEAMGWLDRRRHKP